MRRGWGLLKSPTSISITQRSEHRPGDQTVTSPEAVPLMSQVPLPISMGP